MYLQKIYFFNLYIFIKLQYIYILPKNRQKNRHIDKIINIYYSHKLLQMTEKA